MGIFSGGPKLARLPDLAYDPADPMTTERYAIELVPQFIVYGPGDLNGCFSAVSSPAPAFEYTELEWLPDFDGDDGWFARLPRSRAAWTCIEGPAGSAVYVSLPVRSRDDLERLFGEVIINVEGALRRPWAHATVKPGEPYPSGFAEIFGHSSKMRAWDISRLAHLRPDTAMPRELPWTLKSAMRADGWTRTLPGLWSRPYRYRDTDSEVTLVMDGNLHHKLCAFVGRLNGDHIPQELLAIDVRPSQFEVLGSSGESDRVLMIARRLAADRMPDPDTFRRIVAEVADQATRLAGIPLDDGAAHSRISPHSAPPHSPPPPPPPPAPVERSHPRTPRGPRIDKGGNASLSNTGWAGGRLTVLLGARVPPGSNVVLDASAVAADENGRVLSDAHFVFFDQTASPDGAITHGGAGIRPGSTLDEVPIRLDPTRMPVGASHVYFIVSACADDPAATPMSFPAAMDAWIRVVDDQSGAELIGHDLEPAGEGETAVIFGEVYRRNDEWKFRAVAQGYRTGLAGVARDFGVRV